MHLLLCIQTNINIHVFQQLSMCLFCLHVARGASGPWKQRQLKRRTLYLAKLLTYCQVLSSYKMTGSWLSSWGLIHQTDFYHKSYLKLNLFSYWIKEAEDQLLKARWDNTFSCKNDWLQLYFVTFCLAQLWQWETNCWLSYLAEQINVALKL